MGCNADTGPSQDVGVALGIARSKPDNAYSAMELPPKHPLSINHPLVGQSRIRASSDPAPPLLGSISLPSRGAVIDLACNTCFL